MSANELAPEFMPFWRPPGFRPMSDEAIASLCNGDASETISGRRQDTLIVRLVNGKLPANV